MKNNMKYLIYDFINWVEDTTEDKHLDLLLNPNKVNKTYIDNYISACYYEFNDYEYMEEMSLEDMQEFLYSVYLDQEV